jgi:hypothetical protein
LGSPEPHRRDADSSEPKSSPLEIEVRVADEAVRAQFHVAELNVSSARSSRSPNMITLSSSLPIAPAQPGIAPMRPERHDFVKASNACTGLVARPRQARQLRP